MNSYYVYAHSIPGGRVFYVGKGRGIRQHQTGNRNKYWKRIVKKYGYSKTIIDDGLSENEAFEREIYWIKHFKKQGECDANFTNGGDGVRVDKRWWNEAISKALTGKKSPSGKESKSYKDVISKNDLIDLYSVQKLSSIEISNLYGVSYTSVISRLREYGIEVRKAGREKKKIICEIDGVVFNSITDAAKHYGLFRENIRKVLNGKYKHTGGKIFRYVSDSGEVN